MLRLRKHETNRNASGRHGSAGRALAVVASVALAAGGVTALTAAPAQALPPSCTLTVGLYQAGGSCTNAAGSFRVFARCKQNGGTKQRIRYGSWVRFGAGYSVAYCPGGYHLPSRTHAGFQRL